MNEIKVVVKFYRKGLYLSHRDGEFTIRDMSDDKDFSRAYIGASNLILTCCEKDPTLTARIETKYIYA